MLQLKGVHHIAVIVSDYERSKDFYCRILGFMLLNETWRESRHSWKADLALNGHYLVELFSFPDALTRASYPDAVNSLFSNGINCEPVRIDPLTGRRFTFFCDPDGLPLELYQDADSH